MRIDALNFTQLRLVEALARTGNLSEAAEQIGITQPTASHALGQLRQRLQDPIFVRTSEGMQATPYGSRFAISVRDALQGLRAGVEQHPKFVPADSKRTFNVFMSGVGQLIYLPRLLSRISVDAPEVTLRVRAVPTKAPHQMLESGEVDLAVGSFTRLVTGCRQKLLFRERYVCIVRKDHPAFKKGMTAEAFCKVPHALAEPSGYVHEHLDHWIAQQKIQRVVKLHMPYFLALPLIIARSNMLGIIANSVAEIYAKMVPLKIMPPPTKLPAANAVLFWHERFHRDSSNIWLRGVFTELFKLRSH